MKKTYEGLWERYMVARFLDEPIERCVDWAAHALKEGIDDEEVRHLASLDRKRLDDIRAQAGAMLGKDGEEEADAEVWAGQYISRIAHEYFEGKKEVADVNSVLSRLNSHLGSPDWLGTLQRTCEFIADIPTYREPFEAELKYISKLWSHARNLVEFNNAYDHRISSKHDLR